MNCREIASGSVWRWSAAGAITRTMAIVTSTIAARCSVRSVNDSCSPKPALKTAMSWNPKSACMPGTTVRHSSSTCVAASLSDSSCRSVEGFSWDAVVIGRNVC